MGIKITVYNKDGSFNKEFQGTSDIALLDQLIEENTDIYYGCMGGSCSACKCKILKGMEHIDKEGFGKQVYQGVKENEVLSCITKIKDKDCEIEIEKVL